MHTVMMENVTKRKLGSHWQLYVCALTLCFVGAKLLGDYLGPGYFIDKKEGVEYVGREVLVQAILFLVPGFMLLIYAIRLSFKKRRGRSVHAAESE